MAQVNGVQRQGVDGMSLADVLSLDGFDARRVACELNEAIVSPDAYATTILGPDDALEVVRFVGGG